jgi:DNA helicase HerA-like ATPase
MTGEFDVVGQVIGGDTTDLLLREKSGRDVELGELLAVDVSENDYLLLKVTDLSFGSQVSASARELAAGLRLEREDEALGFYEPELRHYTIVHARAVLRVTGGVARPPKCLPPFFDPVRRVTARDFAFLGRETGCLIGRVRSGSRVLDVSVRLDPQLLLQHHVLVPAATGRGKSNCLKAMLWNLLGDASAGILVLDPHDEYFGRRGPGLKDHPNAADRVVYYTPDTTGLPGAFGLVLNLADLSPDHFQGILEFSDRQEQDVRIAHARYGRGWISHVLGGDNDDEDDAEEEEETTGRGKKKRPSATEAALARKLEYALGVRFEGGRLRCDSAVFSVDEGQVTVNAICDALEAGRCVVIDTSRLSDQAELLIGSCVLDQVLRRAMQRRTGGEGEHGPTIAAVVEEAPRVLAKDRLRRGPNVYERVAREGRKFRIGLVAVTQLASVIPVEILANMNTKIILGNELASERNALVASAAQDLSADARAIASLDRGEAIVSSTFTRFAIPIQIPHFEELVKEAKRARRAGPRPGVV